LDFGGNIFCAFESYQNIQLVDIDNQDTVYQYDSEIFFKKNSTVLQLLKLKKQVKNSSNIV
jgi:hypothetical protein